MPATLRGARYGDISLGTGSAPWSREHNRGMVSRRRFLLVSAGAAVGALTGCADDGEPMASTPAPSSRPPPSPAVSPTGSRTPTPEPNGTVTASRPPRPRLAGTVAEDLDVPWGMVFLASGDALVSERNTGRIRRVTAKGKATTLGEVAGVAAPSGVGEGGLLGIALAPGDDETLFAYLSTDNDNRVVRLSLTGGKISRPHPVLTDIPTSVHHNGGGLRFDADGLLFVSTGDAEQPELAQDRDSPAGKILRIRPDGRAAPGNPFGNRTWSYGHRNVEGIALDRQNRLWATEFGEQETDELNLISRGRNYGWPEVEGRSRTRGFVSPKASWSPTDTCSPAGLAITRGTAFVGALRGECLFAVPLSGTDTGEPKAYFARDHGRLRAVAVAPDGALWVTTSNTDGRVEPGRHDDKILRVIL
jgi:glucose/arabinose dehydrogenase